MTLVKMRPQKFWDGENVLPMRNGQRYIFFHPIAIRQHAFLMASRAEMARLAAESEQIIGPTVVAVDPGKSFVQIPAINEPVQDAAFDAIVNGTAGLQFIIMPANTLIGRTGPRISRPINGRMRCCLPATHLSVLRDER